MTSPASQLSSAANLARRADMVRVFAQDDDRPCRLDWETRRDWPAWIARPGRPRLHCHEEHDHEWTNQWSGVYAMTAPYLSENDRIEKDARRRRALLKEIAYNLDLIAEGDSDGDPCSWLSRQEIPF
jgi:hypothetical protein